MSQIKDIFILCLIIIILILIDKNIKYKSIYLKRYNTFNEQNNNTNNNYKRDEYNEISADTVNHSNNNKFNYIIENIQNETKDNKIIDDIIEEIKYKQSMFFNKVN